MNSYELTLVLEAEGKEADKTLEKVKGWVEAAKGKISKTEKMGTKNFSYPIRKLTQGFYVLCLVELDPASVAEVDRRLRIEPSILRYLLVKAET